MTNPAPQLGYERDAEPRAVGRDYGQLVTLNVAAVVAGLAELYVGLFNFGGRLGAIYAGLLLLPALILLSVVPSLIYAVRRPSLGRRRRWILLALPVAAVLACGVGWLAAYFLPHTGV